MKLRRDEERPLPSVGTAAASCVRLLSSGRNQLGIVRPFTDDLESHLVTPWLAGYSTGSKFVILLDDTTSESGVDLISSETGLFSHALALLEAARRTAVDDADAGEVETGHQVEIEAVPTSVSRLRTTLGLNMTELAQVLGVERQTVYAWLRGDSQPHKANLRRLYSLSRLAQAQRGARITREAVHAPGDDGRSVADLLTDEVLDEGAIAERLQRIAHAGRSLEDDRPKSWLKEVEERRGVRMVEERGEFDRFTGKRLGPED
jgi:DNA-binding transcriptional regulator YiaG